MDIVQVQKSEISPQYVLTYSDLKYTRIV